VTLAPASAAFEGKEQISMNDLLEIFSKSLVPSKFRVVNFPSLIFLCGGPTNLHAPNHYLSVRDFIYKYLESNEQEIFKKIKLAEEINDWYRDGLYKDLLSFEKDLAGLSAVIILFVESPGSIAELGFFCQEKTIIKKTLIFMHTDHYDDETSFIKLGPIKHIESRYKNMIETYKWFKSENGQREDLDEERLREIAPEITKTIIERVNDIPKEQNWNTEVPGHLILFICDIINIMNIVKIGEIETVLEILDLKITEGDIEKYLFILEKLGLIKKVSSSSGRYYAALISEPFIKYSYTGEAIAKDRMRWMMMFRELFSKKDEKRNRAYIDFEKKYRLGL